MPKKEKPLDPAFEATVMRMLSTPPQPKKPVKKKAKTRARTKQQPKG
jgi:hypothetical protein